MINDEIFVLYIFFDKASLPRIVDGNEVY